MNYDVVEAVIKIPYRSRNKYDIVNATGRIRFDRILYSAMGLSDRIRIFVKHFCAGYFAHLY